ncbi:MAG: raffinose/stachyose/melibiose transport system substrate-binding protein [Clostridiales bacterium]|nr:raffinose/stachyose/melibiose transport system substrate-binding protein [Clostridiales bacterium]
MKLKKILSVLLVTVMLVSVLAACGSNDTTTTTTAAPADTTTTEGSSDETSGDETTAPAEGEWEYKEATLSFLIDSDVSLDGFKAVAALAEEKLGITIEYEMRAGGADGDNVVKTRLASGDMADLCGYNSGSLLAALNPGEYFIDINEYDWSNVLDDTYKSTVSVDGKTFGVPLSSGQAGAVIYNKEMYEKYDLEVPATWADFVANCEVLKENGETPIVAAYGDSWTSQVLFLGDFYNVLAQEPDFSTEFEAGNVKYATTPAALESFRKYEDIQDFYNEDYLATTYDDACDMMAEGEGAHWFMLTQAISNINSLYGKEVADNMGVFGVPGDDASNQGITVWMPTSIYGNKNSEKVDDIARFMEFYTSTEALDAMTGVQLPDGPFYIKYYELPEDAYEGVKNDMQAYFDAGKTATAMEFQTSVKGPNCPAICQEVGSGQITADEAATKYDDDCYKQAVQLGLDWEQ